MPGHLAAAGGMRDSTDMDSSVTAVREVFEETGLLDVGYLPVAGSDVRLKAQQRGQAVSLVRISDATVLCKVGNSVGTEERRRWKKWNGAQGKEFNTSPRFGEGAHVDWWLLLLSGSGSFLETSLDGSLECADISTLLPQLPGARLAPCFGHAWVEAERVSEIPTSVQLMGGLQRRVREALDILWSMKITCTSRGKWDHPKRIQRVMLY
eukprot:Skav226455  [mRNA]  locus=scaffold1781:4607:6671:+ [translate_table: standard]